MLRGLVSPSLMLNPLTLTLLLTGGQVDTCDFVETGWGDSCPSTI